MTVDPSEAFVTGPDGARYWGRFGAAGLLLGDSAGRVLLQHRAPWGHQGGTWALPGGALAEGEDPISGALREAAEEAGVPPDAVRVLATRVFDAEVWRYTTVVARASRPVEARATDDESVEVRWVPVDEVVQLPLHPAFAEAWPVLQTLLSPVTVVVDGANVVGSVPNGWWRDRRGAAERLRDRLARIAAEGLAGAALDRDAERMFPAWLLVTEGAARGLDSVSRVRVASAPGSGDDEIVRRVADAHEAGERVVVVTADRGLRERVPEAVAHGPRWLPEQDAHVARKRTSRSGTST